MTMNRGDQREFIAWLRAMADELEVELGLVPRRQDPEARVQVGLDAF